jgi:cell division protein FtsB
MWRGATMGFVDNQQTEEALNDLRERNAALRSQNADLKDFLKHLNDEITNFLQYNTIKKEL